MKRTSIILMLSSLLLACNSNNVKEKELLKKENELLKRELEIEKKENKTSTKNLEQNTKQKSERNKESKNEIYKSTISELKNLLNNDFASFQIDNNGVFSFDMGSASAGRVSGNLKDVILSIEHKPERPGCADVCPPMKIIHFNCLDENKCVKDPAFPEMGSYSQGVITFENLEVGKKTYELLIRIQKNL